MEIGEEVAGNPSITGDGNGLQCRDGAKVANTMDLNIILNRKRPGDTVTLTVYRGGKKLDIPVKLGERNENVR